MPSLCERGNAPIKPLKVESPSISLTFLGIHLNTTTMEASITSDWKQALLSKLLQLRYQLKRTKWALLSLIEKLSFCCKILPTGRIFLQRLIDLSTTVKKLHHHLPLSVDTKLDLQWWLDFLPQEKVSSFKPAGFPILQCSYIQTLLEPMDGYLIVWQVGRSLVSGAMLNCYCMEGAVHYTCCCSHLGYLLG